MLQQIISKAYSPNSIHMHEQVTSICNWFQLTKAFAPENFVLKMTCLVYFQDFSLGLSPNFTSNIKPINSLHDGGRYHIENSPLICKSMDWFLYDIGLRHEKVN